MSKLQNYFQKIIENKFIPFCKKFSKQNQISKEAISSSLGAILWSIMLYRFYKLILTDCELGWGCFMPFFYFILILMCLYITTNLYSVFSKNKTFALIINNGASLYLILWLWLPFHGRYIYRALKTNLYDDIHYFWFLCHICLLGVLLYTLKKASLKGSFGLLLLLLVLSFFEC